MSKAIGAIATPAEATKEKKLARLFFAVVALFHVFCFLAFFTGVSNVALLVAFIMYVLRGMGITMGYHRYFSHKSFKTGRFFQGVLAFFGSLACQGGVLWWSSHHREHHRVTDKEGDIHSPKLYGFWYSHIGWLFAESSFKVKDNVKDLLKFPELKFFNKYYSLLILLQILFLYGLGEGLNHYFPYLETNGAQMVVWGQFISVVFLWHCTFMVNSICHIFGTTTYESGDTSKNNVWVALLTFGEGWHNNHHKYGWSARNGMKWWEFDPTYYTLLLLRKVGVVHSLKLPKNS